MEKGITYEQSQEINARIKSVYKEICSIQEQVGLPLIEEGLVRGIILGCKNKRNFKKQKTL